MSDGKCGAHSYNNYDQAKIDKILAELKKRGMKVTGNNPWDVDTQNHGVKLRATWDKGRSVLTVIVTDKNWYVPCSKIWDTIDPLLKHVSGLTAAEI